MLRILKEISRYLDRKCVFLFVFFTNYKHFSVQKPGNQAEAQIFLNLPKKDEVQMFLAVLNLLRSSLFCLTVFK